MTRESLRRGIAAVTPALAVLGAALAVSACGGSATPGVLTSADIPSYLGVKANPSAAASEARSVRPAPCKTAAVDAFGVPARHANTRSRIVSTRPFIVSVALTCDSVSQAQTAFNLIKKGGDGHALAGIGDEARLINVTEATQRVCTVGWRDGNQVGVVFVLGPIKDTRITPALTELLARRAIARAS
jgi:hypothetical protein